jgi:ankyrin repeat protein
MRIAKATGCATCFFFLFYLLAGTVRTQDEQSIDGLPVKIKREHYGFRTRFVEIIVSRQYYSKENLERLWRHYCEKYPDKKDKLDIRVFVELGEPDSKAAKERSFDANFYRQGEGAAALGGDNEFYSYRPDLDKPDKTVNVQLKGKYPFLRDSYSGDPAFDFVLAARKGELARLEAFLKSGGDVNAQDEKGRTALMAACETGRTNIVKMLLASGANPNLQNNDGDTALNEATTTSEVGPTDTAGSRGGNIVIVKLLLASGADARTATGDFPPLICAASYGNNAIVKLLLKEGANINAKNWTGMSALARSIYDGRYETTKILLAHGADIESRDDSGNTPLILAAPRGLQVLRNLLDRGANANATNNNLETALIHSYSRESVLVLLDHRAEPDAKDKRGMTALMHAAWWRNLEKVRVLLEKGADVNARTPEGETALSIAKDYSDGRTIVEVLLKFGANERKDK